MRPAPTPLDDAWPAPPPIPASASVFHFTNVEGLYGIVKDCGFWASEASGLNDPTEMTGGMKRIYQWMRRNAAVPAVRRVLDVVPERPEPFGRIFVLSACLDGDDAGQWRSYGDDGRGCAIELDPGVPLTVKARQPIGGSTGWRRLGDMAHVTKWTKTLYTAAELDQVMRQLTSWAARELDEAERYAASGDDTAGETAVEAVAGALLAVAALLKPPGYRGEVEARVVATLVSRTVHTEFRPARYGLVQHATLAESVTSPGTAIKHDGEWRLPIRSVRLGPHAAFDLSRDTVKDFLYRSGYVVGEGVPGHVRVLKSRTPMR